MSQLSIIILLENSLPKSELLFWQISCYKWELLNKKKLNITFNLQIRMIEKEIPVTELYFRPFSDFREGEAPYESMESI